MPYELIDHTADIGIKVNAETLEGLFTDSAIGTFEIIGHVNTGVDQKVEISLKSNILEDLLHDWLSELLYIYETDNIAFSKFKFGGLDETHLKVTAYGEVVEPENAKTEIKAVTYHNLEVKKDKKGYSVKIIFDI
ncbi:MAG: hypothetical protein COT45_02215 [bacterium (Candidatus Stahlbacteria) CG08_land_8_20_14_0_20_40_26]|nr:MAG: hypothetical protein COX49_08840 [bacterium (Candidatus Stahlbacteria) CG23_combo_of_CG06-09_8_20_14_all_40_9]PIS25552.1 MAG: hypothetical protein COT45_02215 [bacterium (Candidatus Stahlbacteria) CG08_land_8_20_14_0_20_40_26]